MLGIHSTKKDIELLEKIWHRFTTNDNQYGVQSIHLGWTLED